MCLTISANLVPESGLATLLILFSPAFTHFPNGRRRHQQLAPLRPKETAQHITATFSFKSMT
ncbi:hypothetical protein B7R78_0018240 [Ralstonia solanacearum]|uniref:hypothetical protein n=1 Tax=Ralstonia solanacearum TaxID=305 RepID=UPI001142A429|nr:hypothetical protein [Ralstonia solanacearum]MBT1538967.1 hypothetical protein [Ralstonia solanacearum]